MTNTEDHRTAAEHSLVQIRDEWTRAWLESAADRHDQDEVERLLARLRRVAGVPKRAKVLEVGVGSGWLLSELADRGFECEAVEYNDICRNWAVEATGGTIPIRLGSIESIELPANTYDVILAESVLEHVPDHLAALANVFRALKPGGVFHLNSTNKFSPLSGEFPPIPLYGWLPRRARMFIRLRPRLSRVRAEPSFFDWHQFTYPGLRRDLRRTGFSRVLDRLDVLEHEDKTGLRRIVILAYKHLPVLKDQVSLFMNGTDFYCVK